MKKILLTVIAAWWLLPKAAAAHCPLCTAGAGALAVLAASLGVSSVIVGLLIGAFSLALGLWLARLPAREYFPYQEPIFIILVFLATVVPIMPLVVDYGPLYLSLAGPYGSLLHNTYVINLYVLGLGLGAVVMGLAPLVSRGLTRLRTGQTLPYQGITITLLALIIASVIIQLLS